MREDREIRVIAERCPFCGSDDIMTQNEDEFDKLGLFTIGIGCNGCGAELRSDVLRDYEGNIIRSYEGAFENALAKWNRRAK